MSDRITAEEAQRLLDDAAYDCDPADLFPWKWQAWVGADGDGGRIGSITSPNGLRPDGGQHTYWSIAGSVFVNHGPLLAAAPELAAEVVRLTAERDQAQRIILETLTREAAFQRYHHQTVDALAAERDEAQMEYADCLRRRDELAAERDELRQAIWDACRILGMDTDGDPTPAAHVFPPLAELIVREATAARAAYDEALDDATDMEGRYREQVDELYRRLDGRCLNVGPNGERCMGAEGHDGGHWNSQTFPILGGAS